MRKEADLASFLVCSSEDNLLNMQFILIKVFTTEGGLSNGFQRAYVHVYCPFIKVNVKFETTSK